VVATTLWGCPSYKPYLEENYRGAPEDPDANMPGLFSGKTGGFVLYER